MFRKAYAFLFVGLLAALVLALPVLYASAQDNTSDDTVDPLEIQIIGTVDSFDGTTLSIGGFSFDVTGLETDSTFAAGTHVQVTITLSDTGEWVVTEIEVDDDSNEDADLGNEDNQDVGNDDNDDLGNEDNGDVDGDGDNADDENLDADNDDDQGEDDNSDTGNDDDQGEDGENTHIIGTVEAIGDGFIVVGGQTIDTTNAEIEDTLFVGALVDIEVEVSGTQLIASQVQLAEVDDNSGSGGDDDLFGGCAVPAGWTTYEIQAGDSLSGIASRSGTSIDALTQANCISTATIIHPGDVIAVPRTPDPRPVVDNEDDDNDDNSDLGNDDNSDVGNDDDGNEDDNGGNSGPGDDQDEDNSDAGNDDDNGDDDQDEDNSDVGNDDDNGGDDQDEDNSDVGNDDDNGGDDDGDSSGHGGSDDDNSGHGGDDDNGGDD